ncbi:MAG: hypothetical protein QW078_02930 [Thermoplasmatales archaeon]
MFRIKGHHSYLLIMEEFNSAILEDFVKSFGRVVLLLGDGVFVDAYRLKRNLGDDIYIQRILNMYQFQKTIVEDFFYDDLSIFIALRLSEIKEWKEGILRNVANALESISRKNDTPNIFYLIEDEEFKPLWLDHIFRYKVTEKVREWEEIPQALEWK